MALAAGLVLLSSIGDDVGAQTAVDRAVEPIGASAWPSPPPPGSSASPTDAPARTPWSSPAAIESPAPDRLDSVAVLGDHKGGYD